MIWREIRYRRTLKVEDCFVDQLILGEYGTEVQIKIASFAGDSVAKPRIATHLCTASLPYGTTLSSLSEAEADVAFLIPTIAFL